ncbi:hypothetical protein [Streptomyces sp. NPDC058475]|uniref:hypothetical protein n=1 Tax=Streptomyces sp. NPDC058475 TaxID=3346518 RepID=UPI00365933B1
MRARRTAMSWFSLGGNLGFASAPPAVSAAVALGGGLRSTSLLILPALAGAGAVRGGGTRDRGAHARPRAGGCLRDRADFRRRRSGVVRR